LNFSHVFGNTQYFTQIAHALIDCGFEDILIKANIVPQVALHQKVILHLTKKPVEQRLTELLRKLGPYYAEFFRYCQMRPDIVPQPLLTLISRVAKEDLTIHISYTTSQTKNKPTKYANVSLQKPSNIQDNNTILLGFARALHLQYPFLERLVKDYITYATYKWSHTITGKTPIMDKSIYETYQYYISNGYDISIQHLLNNPRILYVQPKKDTAQIRFAKERVIKGVQVLSSHEVAGGFALGLAPSSTFDSTDFEQYIQQSFLQRNPYECMITYAKTHAIILDESFARALHTISQLYELDAHPQITHVDTTSEPLVQEQFLKSHLTRLSTKIEHTGSVVSLSLILAAFMISGSVILTSSVFYEMFAVPFFIVSVIFALLVLAKIQQEIA
jgi:hypothetical protein